MVAGWEATVYSVFRPITLTSEPTHKESFEQPVFGGIRWAFCPIVAEWIQSLQTDMFTKHCVGGVREITCATLSNRGLIIVCETTTCFCLTRRKGYWTWTGSFWKVEEMSWKCSHRLSKDSCFAFTSVHWLLPHPDMFETVQHTLFMFVAYFQETLMTVS